mmetsp:Transcript_135241/g.238469  ORF Transcript_135241/g.238469 Transcript_135241/m.238469 type:complete len:270 (-) Transcript_135241:123-932(-)
MIRQEFAQTCRTASGGVAIEALEQRPLWLGEISIGTLSGCFIQEEKHRPEVSVWNLLVKLVLRADSLKGCEGDEISGNRSWSKRALLRMLDSNELLEGFINASETFFCKGPELFQVQQELIGIEGSQSTEVFGGEFAIEVSVKQRKHGTYNFRPTGVAKGLHSGDKTGACQDTLACRIYGVEYVLEDRLSAAKLFKDPLLKIFNSTKRQYCRMHTKIEKVLGIYRRLFASVQGCKNCCTVFAGGTIYPVLQPPQEGKICKSPALSKHAS